MERAEIERIWESFMEIFPGISGRDKTLSEESTGEEFSWKGDKEGVVNTEGKWGRELAVSGRKREGTDLPSIIPYMEVTGKQSSVGIEKWLS